ILGIRVGVPLAGGLLGAVVLAAAATLPLAFAASRLRGDSFVVATLGYQALVTSILENWVELTGGPLGLTGIPRRIVGPWAISTNIEFALVALGLAALTVLVAARLSTGPFGRVLHCIRDDEAVALSLGKNVRRVKLEVLVVSGAMAGAAGSVYAGYATFVDPSSFTLNESIAVATMTIIGGQRTIWGPVLGAGALVLLPELLRFSGIPHTVAASVNQAIFGGALVWIVLRRPQGLLGTPSLQAPGRVRPDGK
ncbi:MAG: branched-chain amino acid ABC transporter permease, partial [bacterium]